MFFCCVLSFFYSICYYKAKEDDFLGVIRSQIICLQSVCVYSTENLKFVEERR
ncbi:hypothetical protein N665_1177s0020 [Sinapis alba]|nr:hypothetical protein N665_1398s0001 [Sinapis alba]KAF8063920.1 hypothetical protein N665_1177s0020 [Sinapis alba]